MGKNKKNLFSKPTKTKRLKKTKSKTKRIKKAPESPYKITIRDWSTDMMDHKKLNLHEDSKLEIMIDGSIYTVSIDKKNRCLQFDTHETHMYLQPISVHTFLIKANSKK